MDKQSIKIIIISTLFMYIGLFEYSSVTVVLPSLSSALDISSTLTNWISITFLLFCTGFGLTFGTIIPKYGINKVAKISVISMIIGGLIATFILNPWTLIFARAIEGISAASMFLISYLLIIQNMDSEKVGLALGIVTAGGFFSSISAPIIGGVLSSFLPPQSIFAFSIPLSLICLILLCTLKMEWKENVEIDYLGTAFWVITMILFIYGVSYLKSTVGIACLILSVVFLVIFVLYELKAEHPLYDFRLLKNKIYAVNNYAAMMGCFIKDGMVFVLTLYLQYAKGFTAMETGFFISLIAVIMFITSPIAGRLSDKMDSVRLSNAGANLMVISTLIICLVRYLPSWSIIVSIVCLALGYALFDTPNKKIILESSEESQLSYVTAFLSTIRDFGMLLPTAIFTLSLSMFSGIRHGAKYWGTSSEFLFILFFIAALSIIILNAQVNKRKVIFKFNYNQITKPITNTVGGVIDNVSEVPEFVKGTVTESKDKVIDTVSDVPDNLSNTADNIEILKYLRKKK